MDQPIDRKRPSRLQRNLGGGDRTQSLVFDFCLAEEDEGAIVPKHLVDLIRIGGQPAPDAHH
ncbi:hypothetical protein D9M72_613130 [compost metagenome]